jgi:hypothetical protein
MPALLRGDGLNEVTLIAPKPAMNYGPLKSGLFLA